MQKIPGPLKPMIKKLVEGLMPAFYLAYQNGVIAGKQGREMSEADFKASWKKKMDEMI